MRARLSLRVDKYIGLLRRLLRQEKFRSWKQFTMAESPFHGSMLRKVRTLHTSNFLDSTRTLDHQLALPRCGLSLLDSGPVQRRETGNHQHFVSTITSIHV